MSSPSALVGVRARIERNNQLPIHRLPNEILAAIFICGYDAIPLDECGRAGDPYDRVTSFSRRVAWSCAIASVCTLWRSVALSTTQLWSSISYSARTSIERPHVSIHTEPAWLQTQLERSRTSSLRLHIEVIRDTGTSDDMMVLPVPASLLPHLPRCKALRLHFRGPSDLTLSFFPISARLDQLEEMYLFIYSWGGDTQSLSTVFLEKLYPPRLKKLYIDERGPNVFDMVPNITRDGLEEFHFCAADYSTSYLHRLFSPPNTIQRLGITTDDVPPDGLTPLPHTACPAVRSLTINEDQIYLFTTSASSLEELTLINVDDDASWSDSMLVTESVWPTLRTLRTTRPHRVYDTPTIPNSLGNPYLQSILTHHPSITTLTFLQLADDTASFIDFLVNLEAFGPTSVLAPSFRSLRHLNFELAKATPTADVQEAQAVLSRRSLRDMFPLAELSVLQHTCVEYAEECICQL